MKFSFILILYILCIGVIVKSCTLYESKHGYKIVCPDRKVLTNKIYQTGDLYGYRWKGIVKHVEKKLCTSEEVSSGIPLVPYEKMKSL